jgi:hypothetical protein
MDQRTPEDQAAIEARKKFMKEYQMLARPIGALGWTFGCWGLGLTPEQLAAQPTRQRAVYHREKDMVMNVPENRERIIIRDKDSDMVWSWEDR